jgi:hypothetical protein
MTLNERIAYAEGRRDEAIKNGSDADISFWRGYIQGLQSHRNDLEREERLKVMKKEVE